MSLNTQTTHKKLVIPPVIGDDLYDVLIKYGSQIAWEECANQNSRVMNNKKNDLFQCICAYVWNPDYEGPEEDELDDSSMVTYQEVTKRLTKALKLTGTAAIIPNVSAKVTGARGGNLQKGVSITVDNETFGSKKK